MQRRRLGALPPGRGYVSCRVPADPQDRPGPSLTASTPPSDFGKAYQAGALTEFFDLAPGDRAAALRLERPTSRQQLADALQRYAQELGAPAPVLENIERLRHPEARAVVTGQQVGLLLGPTFTLSKAVTAVKLAQQLDSPDRPVVPVFWLATQDHDVAEVDHTYLLDGAERLHKVAVELPQGTPAGRVPVTKAMVLQVCSALAHLEPRPQFLEQVTELVEESAAYGRYGDWFAALLTRLLGATGLVLVDPLREDFARLTTHVLEAEIADPARSANAINDAGARLKALGFEPQLGRGSNATNLFIELREQGASSQRVLLRHQGRKFFAEGREFSAADLRALLADDPTVITPAAGLRPVTQDAALPTAVFVLGPGELRYVAQLRGVYAEHGVPMPLAWPRASAAVLEPAAARLLGNLGLSAAAFRAHHEDELNRLLLERSGHLASFESATSTIEGALETLLADAAQLDPTLLGTVERGRRHLEMTLDRLRRKSARALLERDEVLRGQFARLHAHLLPLGQPAERVLNPFSHALKFGVQPLLDRFLTMEPSGEQELVL